MSNYEFNNNANSRKRRSSSDFSESDTESDKPNKQQSSLFIHKLYEMATCAANAAVFGFSEDGMSLKIRNPTALGPVLLRYFKHRNTSSFIRQLNNYGFKTISSAQNGNAVQTFAHPYFYRDGKDMIDSITRKTARNVKKCKGDIIREMQTFDSECRHRFREMEARNAKLERRNEELELENRRLRALFQGASRHVGFGGGPFAGAMGAPPEPMPFLRVDGGETSVSSIAHFMDIAGAAEPMLENNSHASSPLMDDALFSSREETIDAIMRVDQTWECNEFME